MAEETTYVPVFTVTLTQALDAPKEEEIRLECSCQDWAMSCMFEMSVNNAKQHLISHDVDTITINRNVFENHVSIIGSKEVHEAQD